MGNNYMNAIQPVVATHPYMVSPGNHEAYGTQGGGNFSQYVTRFAGLAQHAGTKSGSGTNLWYSWENGPAHFVAFTAESWTMSEAQMAQQLSWLKADLASVDRTATPWVVAYAHKGPEWMGMDQTNWTLNGAAAVLDAYNVDLLFVGHWHTYVRYPSVLMSSATSFPACNNSDASVYTDCKQTIVVVTGAPGNPEINPALKDCTGYPLSLTCTGNYGYGKLQVFNTSHAQWTWATTVPVNGTVDPSYSDAFWVVKTA